MDQARMDRAIERIEAALARIEKAATSPPAQERVGSEGGWNTYRRLKDRIRGAVGELDQLIAELEK